MREENYFLKVQKLWVTYAGRLLAAPNPITLTDSGGRAHQQVRLVAIESHLWPAGGRNESK